MINGPQAGGTDAPPGDGVRMRDLRLIVQRRTSDRLKQAAVVGGVLAAVFCMQTSALANDSDAKLRLLMEQSRAKAAANTAPRAGSAPQPYPVTPLSPARASERSELLKLGEAALSRLDIDAALEAFDRAALIQHAADTEIALVRSYMQGGQYRRAMASGAHTAGAHLDVVAGSAVYAWLLYAGGQGVIGQRLLDEAEARIPQNPVVTAAQREIRSGAPLALGPLLTPPTRLAPYSNSPVLPRSARLVSSGVLVAGGQQAVVPLDILSASDKGKVPLVWVRNGLGQQVKAKVSQRLASAGIALLALEAPLPSPADFSMAVSDAFPGSAGFSVEYAKSGGAGPAWPLLRSGIMGGLTGNTARPEERALGIDMPAGPRGGPVFDANGRLTGLVLRRPSGKGGSTNAFVPVSVFQKELTAPVSATASQPLDSAQAPGRLQGSSSAAPTGRKSVDAIYESSLMTALQVIVAR